MKRNIQLDFLRFCGIFLVMMRHTFVSGHSILDKIINAINTGGLIGVDLFFVLSGYLVSGLIFNEYKLHHSFNIKRFLIRRGFKIYPVYYLFLICSYLFFSFLIHDDDKPTLTKMLYECIFVSNYLGYNNAHLWSICVEEHFYFFLAIVFLLLVKFKKVELKSFVTIYGVLLIAGAGFRLYNYLHYSNFDFFRDYARSHFRLDALFFGVLLSYVAHYKNHIINHILTHKANVVFFILSLLFLANNFLFSFYNYRFGAVINLALNPICFGYIMLNVISYQNAVFVKWITPLAYIGKFSYSIYLFHMIFNKIAIHFFKDHSTIYYGAYFLLAIAGGIAISKAVEYPLLGFRESLFPSRSNKADVSIPAK
jgi:peptidoglycan/LPS O-acetylase OafA/YrhL